MWARAILDASPDITPTSYVGDKQVTGSTPESVAIAADESAKFATLAGERINMQKTVAFANSAGGKDTLRLALPATWLVPFADTEKVLGAPVTYKGRTLAPIAAQRVVATISTVRRVAMVPLHLSLIHI